MLVSDKEQDELDSSIDLQEELSSERVVLEKNSMSKPLAGSMSERLSPKVAGGRAMFLSILESKKAKREGRRLAEQTEKLKVEERWRQDEGRARENKLQDLMRRLNQKKQFITDDKADEARLHLERKLARVQEQAERQRKAKALRIRERFPPGTNLAKKLEQVEAEMQRRKAGWEDKMALSEQKHAKHQEAVKRRLRLKKERRDKQILRSKIHKLLHHELGAACDRYRQEEVRFATIFSSGNISGSKSPSQLAPSTSQPTLLPKLVPDEVLFEHLTNEELQQVSLESSVL